MRWLIVGHYGGENTGDEAMLAGLLLSALRRQPQEFAVITKNNRLPPCLAGRAEVRAFRMGLRNTLRWLAWAQGVILGGGTHFHDDYRGGRYWQHVRYMARISGLSLLARLLGRRVLWLGVGFGPYYRPLTKFLAWLGEQACEWVAARDRASLELAGRWVDGRKIGLAFDLAVLLRGQESSLESGAPSAGRLMLGVSVTSVEDTLTGGPETDLLFWDRFIQALKTVYQSREDLHVRVFVFRGGQREDDNALSARVAGELAACDPQRVALEAYDPDPLSTLASVQRCQKFIATRFHAVVLAYSAGCELLALGYHQKIHDLAVEIQLPSRACLPINRSVEVEEIQARLTELLDTPNFRPQLPLDEAQRRASINLEVLLAQGR